MVTPLSPKTGPGGGRVSRGDIIKAGSAEAALHRLDLILGTIGFDSNWFSFGFGLLGLRIFRTESNIVVWENMKGGYEMSHVDVSPVCLSRPSDCTWHVQKL